MTASDDDFEPKLGRIRARGGRRGERYLRQVLRAASFASGRALNSLGRKIRFDGSRIGRGAGGGRVLSDRHAAFRTRRVIIKTRLVKLGARGLKAARLHLRYVQRDGVTREGTPGEAYDARNDRADAKGFVERSEGDRHQFRFIVAVEDGTEYEELRSFTRRLMAKMEEDLGTKLDWVAVDHFNTGHPHTHVILRGKDESGEDLIIAREYISHGMRQRAVDIATLDLGPRTDLEIDRKLAQEVDQDRLTSIDRRLLRDAGEHRTVEIASAGGGGAHSRFWDALRAARLQHLRRLGLADEMAPGRWRLADNLEPTLRRMGERGDIIKMMHRALKQAHLERGSADYAIFDPKRSTPEVTGRLIERALHDGNERHYMIVDGTDGRSHWIDIGAGESVDHIKRGAIVSVRPRVAEALQSDRTIERVAERNGRRYSVDLHRQQDPRASREFVAAHVRRLEALRRRGIVERDTDGNWHIPAGYLPKAQSYAEQLARRSPVTIEVLSTAPLDSLEKADAATWLDQRLVDDTADVRDSGFGREVKTALAIRRRWLIDQGLAEERQGQIVYRANLLAILRRRELGRVAGQISSEIGLPYAEFEGEKRIDGKYRRRLDLVSGRFALIERGRDFTLVPWRPVLDRNLGKSVAGVVRAGSISWSIGRQRGHSPS